MFKGTIEILKSSSRQHKFLTFCKSPFTIMAIISYHEWQRQAKNGMSPSVPRFRKKEIRGASICPQTFIRCFVGASHTISNLAPIRIVFSSHSSCSDNF